MAGKRMNTALEGVDRNKLYSLDEAVKLVKANATAKFDETVEIAMNLGVDPRHADQMVRGVIDLPNGTGRAQRVAVFARDEKAEEAKAAGADIVGAEDLMETVQGGKIDFDRCIATPDMMPLVGRLGKVLGPRNLMPNPKVGTVTTDVAEAVQSAKGGAVEFRVEKEGILQAGVGKASWLCRHLPAKCPLSQPEIQPRRLLPIARLQRHLLSPCRLSDLASDCVAPEPCRDGQPKASCPALQCSGRSQFFRLARFPSNLPRQQCQHRRLSPLRLFHRGRTRQRAVRGLFHWAGQSRREPFGRHGAGQHPNSSQSQRFRQIWPWRWP